MGGAARGRVAAWPRGKSAWRVAARDEECKFERIAFRRWFDARDQCKASAGLTFGFGLEPREAFMGQSDTKVFSHVETLR